MDVGFRAMLGGAKPDAATGVASRRAELDSIIVDVQKVGGRFKQDMTRAGSQVKRLQSQIAQKKRSNKGVGLLLGLSVLLTGGLAGPAVLASGAVVVSNEEAVKEFKTLIGMLRKTQSSAKDAVHIASTTHTLLKQERLRIGGSDKQDLRRRLMESSSQVSELMALSVCIGVPIALMCAGCVLLAYGMHEEDEMEGYGIGTNGSIVCLLPAGAAAVALASFGVVAASRALLQPDQPVLTPLLGKFFAAFCGVSVLGCCLVGACTHPSRSGGRRAKQWRDKQCAED